MQHYLLSLEYVAVCRLLMRASAKADDPANKSSAEAISRLVRHCTEPINDGIALCRCEIKHVIVCYLKVVFEADRFRVSIT